VDGMLWVTAAAMANFDMEGKAFGGGIVPHDL
jgi:hypothetical protein